MTYLHFRPIGVKVRYQEVLSELDRMVDWFLLGAYLGVPVGKLMEMEEDYTLSRAEEGHK